MSRRPGFSIICSVVFGAFALGLGAFAGKINLPQHNLVSHTSFEPSVATHQTKAASELALQSPSAREIAACEMPLTHEMEGELLAEMQDDRETVVAFALVR